MCFCSSPSDNLSRRYLLPNFIDFVESLTNRLIKNGSRVATTKTTRQSQIHFVCTVHSRHPLPANKRCGLSSNTGGGPSHAHTQHAQKIKIARVVLEISLRTDRQTDRLTDRHTHHNTSQPLPRAK